MPTGGIETQASGWSRARSRAGTTGPLPRCPAGSPRRSSPVAQSDRARATSAGRPGCRPRSRRTTHPRNDRRGWPPGSRRCNADPAASPRCPRPRTPDGRRSRSSPSPGGGRPPSGHPACAAANRSRSATPGPGRRPPGTARPGSSAPGGSGRMSRRTVPVASPSRPRHFPDRNIRTASGPSTIDFLWTNVQKSVVLTAFGAGMPG